MAHEKIIYERNYIFLKDRLPSQGDRTESNKEITGTIRLTQNNHGIFFRFKPSGLEEAMTDDWALVNGSHSVISYKNSGNEREAVAVTPNPLLKFRINFNINDLRSIRRDRLLHGITHLTFVLKDGRTLPVLYFKVGGSKELVHLLQLHIPLEK